MIEDLAQLAHVNSLATRPTDVEVFALILRIACNLSGISWLSVPAMQLLNHIHEGYAVVFELAGHIL